MSHYGVKLSEMLKEKGISAESLGRKAGISQGQMSRFTRGAQVWVGKDDLALICKHLSPSAADQAGLIVAHLRDEMDIPNLASAVRLIEITISGKPVRASAVPLEVPSAFLKTFQILAAEAVRDPRIADILNNLAELKQ